LHRRGHVPGGEVAGAVHQEAPLHAGHIQQGGERLFRVHLHRGDLLSSLVSTSNEVDKTARALAITIYRSTMRTIRTLQVLEMRRSLSAASPSPGDGQLARTVTLGG